MDDFELTPFQQVVDALLDQANNLDSLSLPRLSNLADNEISKLAGCWDNIPLQKRIDLLNSLRDLADDNPLYFFEQVGKIGLQDPDPQVRLCSIRLSILEESDSLIPVLLEVLAKDTHFEVRAGAAEALGQFVYLGEIEDISEKDYQKVLDGLLQSFRGDEQVAVRQRALEAIGFSSEKAVDSMIEDAIRSGDEDWQASGLVAMGRSANARWRDTTIDMLDHESARIREQAAVAAGRLDAQDAKPGLVILATEDTEVKVRHAAIWALSDIGGKDVQVFLEELLEDAGSDSEEVDLLENALENLLENEMFGDVDLLLFDFDDEDGDE